MVVFRDGAPEKARYRSFKIRGEDGDAQHARQNDDFASMQEVLTRRLRRGLERDDEGWAFPDLIVIDGGKGQLARVSVVMEDLGVEIGAGGSDLAAEAKEREPWALRDAARRGVLVGA